MNISPGEDLTDVKPGKEPYSRAGSEQFFMDVKRGRVREVREALQRDRFLAYQLNEVQETPLIVAAKRNNLEMAKLLIDYKANPTATDHNRKSALYYAHLMGHEQIVHLLLLKSRTFDALAKKVSKAEAWKWIWTLICF